MIFNYIIPIFNKEDVLPSTLEGVEKCAGSESVIIMVVDGCTDNSESIVNGFIKNSSHRCLKIIMPNVHMLRSVNAGMREVHDGHLVIMQDDIVLECADIEKQIEELYELYNNKIGVISLRYGSDISFTSFAESLRSRTWHRMIKETNFIKGPDDHANFQVGEYGKFYEKMNAINGPNIISNHLFRKIGFFDENLAPFGYDDPEYCLRSLKAGFLNGLFPLKYRSDPDWGGTRRSESFEKIRRAIHKRNRIYIYKKHREFLRHQTHILEKESNYD